jgi:hypothetical protein
MTGTPNRANGLLVTSHVILSEFFTWSLDGVARDDAAVKQLAIQQCDRDAEIWGDDFGPGWLTHFLKLIRDGHEVYPKRDGADDLTYEIDQGFFVRAQRWLKRHGGCAADALAEVEQDLARRQDRDPRHVALERLLYDRASTGELVIKARIWDYAKNCAASEYEPIPADFFLRQCKFFYGVLNERSELVRWTDDGSPNWLLDTVFNKNDPPIAYVEAKITREDAFALKDEFITGGSPQARHVATDRKSKRGAKTKIQYPPLREETFRLMEHHGPFSNDDYEWNSQEKLIEALQHFHAEKFGPEPGRSTLQPHVARWLAEYKTQNDAGN